MKTVMNIALACSVLSAYTLVLQADEPPPPPPSFSVTNPVGDEGYFCVDKDVIIYVGHDCTNHSASMSVARNLGKKEIGLYTDQYATVTLSGTGPDGKPYSESQTSEPYFYMVVDVEGEVIRNARMNVTGEVYASTLPGNGSVLWGDVVVSNQNPKKPVKIATSYDTNHFWITVLPKSGDGSLTVKAMHPYLTNCSQIFNVGITCDAYPGGSSKIENACVNAAFRFGQGKRGMAGLMQIYAETPDTELATPRHLALSAYDPEIEAIRVPDGGLDVLRQVKAPQCLADIVINSPFQYEIRFYKSADGGAKDTNGLYFPTGAPFVSYLIENPAASTNNINTLRITKQMGGSEVVYEYVYSEAAGVGMWALSSGNGLKVDSLSEVTNALGRVLTRTVQDATGNIASKTKTTYRDFDWGREMVEEVIDPDGAALTTTRTFYDEDAQLGQYSKLASVVNADGSWTRYDYNQEGRETLVVSSWLNAAINAPASQARAIYKSYTPVASRDDGSVLGHQPRLVEEKILGITVSRTFSAYYSSTNNPGERVEIEESAAAATAAYGAPGNLRTTRVYYPYAKDEPQSAKLKSIAYPDGRLDSFDYEAGEYASGTFAPGTGDYIRVSTTHGTAAYPAGIAGKTTAEKAITDKFGRTMLEEKYVYTGGGHDRIAWTRYTRDEFGRELSRISSDGSQADSTWACCGKDYEKDENGIEHTYAYDELQRLVFSTKAGIAAGAYPAQEATATTYTLDALGRRAKTVVSAGALSQVSSNTYDLVGRQVQSVSSAGLVTTKAYANNGLIVTETLPGGFTRITEKYPDGKTKSITGTAAPAQYYEYGVNSDGSQRTKVTIGASGGPVWQKTTTDFLGRTAKVEKPGYSTTEVTENFYNNKGQLEKQFTVHGSQLTVTLYAYDELGNQIRSGLDVNGNDSLDLDGIDRIYESETSYELSSGVWHLTSVNRLYATDNSAETITSSITRQQLTGLGGSLASATVSIDAFGNETITTITVDRDAKKVTRAVDLPNSTGNDISISVNGLLVSAQRSMLSAPTLYAYDAFGRPIGVTDPRTGTATTHYDNRSWVDYTEDAAGNRTTFTYDPATGRGISKTDPLSNTTYFAYTAYGELEKTWGSAIYPVSYEYDAYNRMIKQHTFRNGTGWEGSTWPANPGTADTTEWIYHEASGLLTSKKDAAGKSVSYTYLPGGRLATRTWARVVGAVPPNSDLLVTTYSYSPAGDLIGIDYSDSTPDVSFTYDRLGRQTGVVQSGSGTGILPVIHSFAYNGLLLASETIVSATGTNVIERSYDALGRSAGFALNPSYSVQYSYDPVGRFSAVSSSVSSASISGEYSYLPNSDLLSGLTSVVGPLSSVSTRSYEPNRNLLTQVKNSVDGQVISQFDYANDALGRRTAIGYSGTAFSTGDSFNQYGYNTRSEVTAADRYWGSNEDDLSDTVSGQSFAYGYDNIGNREYSMRDNAESLYTANNLNQYTERTVPGSVDILGSAATNATVTVAVNGGLPESVNRHETYWHAALSVDNQTNAVYPQVKVVGAYNPPTEGQKDVIATETGRVFVAQSPEQFSYDVDGNTLQDGRFNYTWDAESRLISVESASSVDKKIRVEFQYDYMNRRIAKKIYSWVGIDPALSLSNGWLLASSSTFLYDGWNLIQEHCTRENVAGSIPLSVIIDSYVWGLDLNGLLQAEGPIPRSGIWSGGGIGGLLARTRVENRYIDPPGMLIICHRPTGNPENRKTIRINESAWPAHEAHGDSLVSCSGPEVTSFLYTFDGNGNVSELLLSSPVSPPSSVIAAHYEYSPFGETIVSSGSEASDNPFRFSTKYFVDEIGLGDWSQRWHTPSLGRWLSRDPIGESGGINLYLYVNNSPLNLVDYLGEDWVKTDSGNTDRRSYECECGDIVRGLADSLSLSPNDFALWLEPTGGSPMPSTADEPIVSDTGNYTYTVPNKVAVDRGTHVYLIPWTMVQWSAYSFYESSLSQGYAAELYPVGGFHTSEKDLIKYGFYGHGENGWLYPTATHSIGLGQGKPHHKLAYVILMACDSYTGESSRKEWVSKKGMLLTVEGDIPGVFTTRGYTWHTTNGED